MAEEYLNYMSQKSEECKSSETEKLTIYNGDVTEQDLKCWALSAKTCSKANSKALESEKNQHRSWKKSIKANKKFAIMTTDPEFYPTEFTYNNHTSSSVNENYFQIHIECFYEPGKVHHQLLEETSHMLFEMPLSLSCPSCWSTLRTARETIVDGTVIKRKRRQKRQKLCHKFTPRLMSKPIRHPCKMSSATKAVRSIKKAAVDKARTNFLSPRKLDLLSVGSTGKKARITNKLYLTKMSKAADHQLKSKVEKVQDECSDIIDVESISPAVPSTCTDLVISHTQIKEDVQSTSKLSLKGTSGHVKSKIKKYEDNSTQSQRQDSSNGNAQKTDFIKRTSRGRVLKQRRRDY